MKKYLYPILSMFLAITLVMTSQPHQVFAVGIAFDAKTDGSNTTGTSLSWTHTSTGSNLIGYVGIQSDFATDAVTTVTWCGTGMTLVKKDQRGGNSRWSYTYQIVGQASGACTVTINTATSVYIEGGSISYSGANQSGQPDASNNASGDSASPTVVVTSVSDNDWCLQHIITGGGTLVTGSQPLRMSINGGVRNSDFYDTNGVVHPAGVTTFNATISGSPTTYATEGVCFSPSTGAAVAGFNPYYLMDF